MRGTTELKVIERPISLNICGGKNRAIYSKIIATLDVMSSTKCIEISPEEIIGKSLASKCNNLRSALKRTIVSLGKEYTPAVVYNQEKDVIYIWARIKIK